MLKTIAKNGTFCINLLDAVSFIHSDLQNVNRKSIAKVAAPLIMATRKDDYEPDEKISLYQWFE